MKKIRDWFAYWHDFFGEIWIDPWRALWFPQSYKESLIYSLILLIGASLATAIMGYRIICGSIPRRSFQNYFIIILAVFNVVIQIVNYLYLCWKKLTVHKWYKLALVILMSLCNVALIGISIGLMVTNP